MARELCNAVLEHCLRGMKLFPDSCKTMDKCFSPRKLHYLLYTAFLLVRLSRKPNAHGIGIASCFCVGTLVQPCSSKTTIVQNQIDMNSWNPPAAKRRATAPSRTSAPAFFWCPRMTPKTAISSSDSAPNYAATTHRVLSKHSGLVMVDSSARPSPTCR